MLEYRENPHHAGNPLLLQIGRGLLIAIIVINGAAIILLGVKIGWTQVSAVTVAEAHFTKNVK